MPSYFNKPVHWRLQADMTRTIASGMHGEERKILIGIANEYEKMALQVESDAIAMEQRALRGPRPQQRQPVAIEERLVALQRKWNSR
jgi:hypothetical protein